MRRRCIQVLIPSSTLHAPLRHSFPCTICDPQASNTIDNVKDKIQNKDIKAGLRRPRVLRLSVAGGSHDMKG